LIDNINQQVDGHVSIAYWAMGSPKV